jgi:mannosyltransferase
VTRQLASRWAVPAVIFVGFCLRLIGINSRPLFYDEAFSYFLSIQSFGHIIQGTAADTMPPLYYFLLHFWAQIGHSVAWLRGLNVLFSLGVIFLAYRLAADLYGHRAGVWAAALVAVAPFQIYYAQEMRMYTLLALGLTGFAWCFLRLYREEGSLPAQWPLWLGAAGFGEIALYSHNLAGFTLVAPALFLLVKRRWKLLGKLVACLAVMGIGFLPWLLLVPGQVQKIQTAFWTPRPGLVEILQVMIMFVTNLPLPGWGIAAAAVVSLWLMVMTILEIWHNHWKDEGLQFLVWYLLAPGAILFGLSYLMRPVFIPRGLIASAVAAYAVLGRLAACGQNRVAGILAGGVFVAASLAALPYQVLYREFPRSPYQEAVAWLNTNAGPGEVVLHENKLSFFSMKFYAPGLTQAFLPDIPGSANDTLAPVSAEAMGLLPAPDAANAVGQSARVEYVVFEKEIQELQASGEPRSPAQAWLEAHYRLNGEKAFGDLLVLEFIR